MSTARVYARNLAYNYGGHCLSLLVMFFLSPFVVHTLGSVEYGIWSLLNVLTGYMGILDLGVRASTGRYIVYYLGRGEHEAVDQTVRTSLGFFTAIGGLMLAAGCLIGWLFPQVFSSVPPECHRLAMLLVPLMAVNLWLSAYGTVFASVLAAHDRFDIARGIDVAVLAVRTTGTITVLAGGMGLLGLVVVTIGCQALARALNWHAARRIYPQLRAWPLILHRARLRELVTFGAAAFISAIAVKVIGQTDLVLVGAAVGLSAVTVYSVGAMLVYYSSSLLGEITTTFFPPLQRAAARGEMGPVRWLFFRQVRLAMILGVGMYVGFIIFAEPFIRLWMLGPEFDLTAVHSAAMVMGVLAGSKLLYLFSIGSPQLLESMGYIRFNAALAIVEAMTNLALSLLFMLVFGWGLVGVAMGTLIARLLVRTFVQPWYACRKARIAWRAYVGWIGGTAIATALLFAMWCLLVRCWIPADTWLSFAAAVTTAIVGYVPIAFCLLLPSDDRSRVWERLSLAFT